MKDKITARQESLWLGAAMAAPLAHTAAGCSWVTVLAVGGGTLLVCRLAGRYVDAPGRILRCLQNLWNCILIAEILHWSGAYWPGHRQSWAAPMILLGLAVWLVQGGRNRTVRAGCMLLWPVGILLSAMLVSGMTDVKLENLKFGWQMPSAWMIPVFMPGIYHRSREVRSGKLEIVLVGAGIVTSLVTMGVLSGGISRDAVAPVYELSRSLSLFGIVERFESIAAAAMTIGYFAAICYLLGTASEKLKEIWAYGAVSGMLFLSGIRIGSGIGAIGSVIVWLLLPAVTNLKKFFQKSPKST